VSLTCKEGLDFLLGSSVCRSIAEREARTIPGVEVGDLLQTAAERLTVSLRRSCPDWSDCPTDGGRTPTPCGLGARGDGREPYVKKVLRRTIWRARAVVAPSRRDRSIESGDDDVDKAPWLTRDELPPFEAGEPRLWLDRLDRDRRRLVDEEPGDVWPGVNRLRLRQKVAAGRLVLALEAKDTAEALRTVDPGRYGALDRPVTPQAAARAHRDGVQVRLICWHTWRRVSRSAE